MRTTPPPSLGGAVVQTGLAELDGSRLEPAGSAAEARALARALGTAYGDAGAGARPTGTTHVSVVDSDGAAVGLSSTLGSGSGVFRHGFQLNNMLGEHDVIGWEPREPGTRLPSMMTPTLVLDADGKPRLVAGSAGSVRLAGAILQVVAGVVGHGLPVAEAIARPRLHVDGETVHVEGGWPDAVAAALAERRPRRPPLGRSQPLLRRGLGGRAAAERHAGRRRRSPTGRSRRRRPMIEIRPADPADASQLIVLAAEVGREPGDWLLTTDTWRAVGDERRYLKAVRRHPDAAVLVATDGPALVGRLSLARDPHPSSAHVADLGLMVAASHRRQGVGRALLDAAVEWARRAGVRKLELHVFPWNEPAIRLYEGYGFEREGVRRGHYERNGDLVDALLMAYHLPSEEEFPPSPAP